MNQNQLSLDEQKKIEQISLSLGKAKRLLVITGAGMSAESGLPTYRGVGGLYNEGATVEGLSIEECLSKRVFESRPELTWKYLGEIEKAARAAKYNRGHELIALLEQRMDVCVLTQNIDGYHIDAGSTDVIEIHGTMRRLRCVLSNCTFEQERDDYSGLMIPPVCPECAGMLRPDVILFDEMLPESALDRLVNLWREPFDAVFSIGTTSNFPYIAGPVQMARSLGILTVEINPVETMVSHLVDFQLRMPATKALSAIWTSIQSLGEEIET